jgi:hypothetical protein
MKIPNELGTQKRNGSRSLPVIKYTKYVADGISLL